MTIKCAAPLVSAIVPCYNQACFLPDAIESTLAQTHRPIEVIVVDDGSPDNVVDLVASYPHLRRVRQKNRGVGETRNAGFGASGGEYVLFLDADDRLTPNTVESHLCCFAKYPEAEFVVGDIAPISLDGSYTGSPRSGPYSRQITNEELLKVNYVSNTIAVMFRRSVIERPVVVTVGRLRNLSSCSRHGRCCRTKGNWTSDEIARDNSLLA